MRNIYVPRDKLTEFLVKFNFLYTYCSETFPSDDVLNEHLSVAQRTLRDLFPHIRGNINE